MNLLIGKIATKEKIQTICDIVDADGLKLNFHLQYKWLTNELLLALDVRFKIELTGGELTKAV